MGEMYFPFFLMISFCAYMISAFQLEAISELFENQLQIIWVNNKINCILQHYSDIKIEPYGTQCLYCVKLDVSHFLSRNMQFCWGEQKKTINKWEELYEGFFSPLNWNTWIFSSTLHDNSNDYRSVSFK